MAAIADVKCWVTIRGVHHVVAETSHGWVFTACGTIVNGELEEGRPDNLRLCKKCRERLKTATVVAATDKQESE